MRLTRHSPSMPLRQYELSRDSVRREGITPELFAEAEGPVAVLKACVRLEVERYIASLPADSTVHPFVARRPNRFKIIGWANILRQSANIHIHPHAWLSGVVLCSGPRARRRRLRACRLEGSASVHRTRALPMPTTSRPAPSSARGRSHAVVPFLLLAWNPAIPESGTPNQLRVRHSHQRADIRRGTERGRP